MDVRGVLCPTDFSEGSRRAFRVAQAVARVHHADLTVLHVYPMAPCTGEVPPWPQNPLNALERDRVLTELASVAAPARTEGPPARVCLLDGDAADEILRYARVAKADLIVLGTRGQGGEGSVLGSVAERVVGRARCAVLTVPPGDAIRLVPPGPVVCALDLVDSEPTLEAAVSMARAFGSELVPVHVLTGPRPGSVDGARHRLERAVAQQDASALAHDCVVASGEPCAEILKVAEERGAGLVVTGFHATRPLERACFESTALQVLRLARCPVLTVRTPEAASR